MGKSSFQGAGGGAMRIEPIKVTPEEFVSAAVASLRGSNQVPVVPAFADRVREVLVVGSSSRGGSSLLSELLRGEDRLVHFQAEINPHLRLAGLSWPGSGTGSDRLDAEQAANCPTLERELAREAGNLALGLHGPDDVDRFAHALHWRLTVQWPGETFARERVADWVQSTLQRLRAEFGWRAEEFRDTQLWHALFLVAVRAEHPAVNPYYYDLDEALIRRFHPSVAVPQGPPSPGLLEEPPFVTIRPWRRVDPAALAVRPLVVKTPSNAYRLPFLRRLFRNARLRVLHLVRNPAACVNGLLDGWLYRGFHAHYIPGGLHIAGYCDRGPAAEQRWWKFDLPPGWQEWTCRPLEEVCAFQWRAAHQAILEFVAAEPVDYFRLRYEDLVGPAPDAGKFWDSWRNGWVSTSPRVPPSGWRRCRP